MSADGASRAGNAAARQGVRQPRHRRRERGKGTGAKVKARFDAAGAEPRLPRGDGRAEIAWSAAGGSTRLRHLYQRTPCRVLFPRVGRDELATAVVLTTSGGLTGGDRVGLDVVVEPGAAAVATTQAAEKIYRSAGEPCTVDVRVTVESGAWLEWIPQETILFDGARLRRATCVRAAGDARVMAGEILVFGRLARGEVFRRGALRDAWRVERDGAPVWMDALRYGAREGILLDHAAGMDGARSLATALYAAADAGAQVEPARRLLRRCRCRWGVTCVNGVLVVRFLARDPQTLRAEYRGFWGAFRRRVQGLPARVPGVWQC